MTWLRVLLSRAADLVLGRSRDARLDDELQAHLDLLADDYRARGMEPAAARRAARRAFGSVDGVRAAYRDQRGLPAVESLVQDLRFAGRQIRRNPAFTATAVAILGLGIGVNTMFFTILSAHTLRGLPIPRADRVVSIGAADDRTPLRGFSYPDFDDIRRRATSFTGLGAFASAPVVVTDQDHAPERVDGAFVSGEVFDVIGTRPVLGRTLAARDEQPGAEAVGVLNDVLWRSRYGADPEILGRSIVVNGTPVTIAGIVPERSGFPGSAQIWLPVGLHADASAAARTARQLMLIGRLTEPATVTSARAEVEVIVERLSREHPQDHTALRAQLVPANERYLGRLAEPAWLAFMAAGCLIVLISCANVANLLLARAAGRAREIAIRRSLGASRARVVRQLLIEGAALAGLGGVLGLGVAMASVRLFASAIPERVLPYWLDYSFDGRVIAALIVVSAATIVVSGLVPALYASRTDVNRVLKDDGHAARRGSGRRWSTVLLAAELALAVVLLAHLAVGIRTASPDFPAERALATPQLLAATITLPEATYATPDQRHAFHDGLRQRLARLPDTTSSLTTALPLMGADPRTLTIAGQPPARDGDPPLRVGTVTIGPAYFTALGVAVVAGRQLDDDDGASGSANAMVNEQFVKEFLAGSTPLGERIGLSRPDRVEPEWFTIAGVVPSIRQRPGPAPGAVVYLPYRAESPSSVSLVVRSAMDTSALVALLRAEVQAIDRNLPLDQVRTMTQVIRDADWNGRLSNRLFLYITGIAVVLATAGLFTVTAYGVSTRTREIGLRMALGAQVRHVVWLVLRRAAAQAALGFAAGVACVKLWGWVFASGRAEIRATDPQSLAIVLMVLTVMVVVACTVPARRAARLDPTRALRMN